MCVLILAWKQIIKSPTLGKITLENFEIFALHDGKCQDEEKEKVTKLEPERRCNDIFNIDYKTTADYNHTTNMTTWTNKTMLIIVKTEKEFEDYNLWVHDDLSYSATVCKANEDNTILER